MRDDSYRDLYDDFGLSSDRDEHERRRGLHLDRVVRVLDSGEIASEFLVCPEHGQLGALDLEAVRRQLYRNPAQIIEVRLYPDREPNLRWTPVEL
jgi:hypothetical protein